MNTSLRAAAAVTFLSLHGPHRAYAATTDVTVLTTLQPTAAGSDGSQQPLPLKGTVTWDADTTEASGTFRLADYANTYKGSAWLAQEGFIFDGLADDETRLYVNLSTDPQGAGSAVLCKLGTQCEFFTSLGGAVSPAK